MATLVIAEAGTAHGGDWDTAHRLVQVAHMEGADVVKFQWTSSSKRMAERRHVRDLDAYRRLEFPEDWHARLQSIAQFWEIQYACTVYLPEDIPVVAPYVSLFKVASFEAGDSAFIQAHGPYLDGRARVVSTGMMTDDEVTAIPDTLKGLKLLLCTSAYPAPLDELQLRNLTRYDGYSDHSGHPLAGAFAVCAGAEIVEVHFRLDDTPSSDPDYAHSHSPASLREYIANIRLAERMLGDGVKRVQPSERGNLRYRVTG